MLTIAFAIPSLAVSNQATKMTTVSASKSEITLHYQIGDIQLQNNNTKGGAYTSMIISGYTSTNQIGEPQLPLNRKLIAVPFGATPIVNIVNKVEKEYDFTTLGITNQIQPTQPSLAKNQDESTVAFEKKEDVYRTNSYTNDPIVKVTELGVLRGIRIFAVDYQPVQYNPVSNKIRVYDDVQVTIEFTGADYATTTDMMLKTASPAFEGIYNKTILNYNAMAERNDITRYPMKLVIISARMFESTLQPYIEWKTQQGYKVITVYTDQAEVGTTTASIKAYITNLWNAATTEDPAPSFILFVGDVAQIPAWTGETDASHVTDLKYVRLVGTDYMPEIMYSRFSANNVAELQPQIDKTLVYEKLNIPDTSYLGLAVLTAGVDDSHGTKYGNGQINTAASLYMNAEHGISPFMHLYPGSGSQVAQIVSEISNGVGWANYTAHGSEDSWYQPAFSIANINSLQNENKYPFVVGNCCLTNHFQTQNCFGEAWLRAANKGAIGYIGGTNSTYWDEDYWWAIGAGTIPSSGAATTYAATGIGVYDGLFHDHAEPVEQQYITGAAFNICGDLAVAAANSSHTNYYWEIYSLMGDPTLIPFMGVPQEQAATIPPTIFIGQTEVQISASPRSFVCISTNGEQHAVGIVDESGAITLPLVPFTEPGTAKIVVYAQNKVPIIQDIQILPNVGPYVIINNTNYTDSNNNIAEYGEIINMSVRLKNVGVENASNLSVHVRTVDEYVTLIDSLATVDQVNSNDTLWVSNFSFKVANVIPDQHKAPFTIVVTDNADHVWSTVIRATLNAPVIALGNIAISDQPTGGNGNGFLEPGEVATITFAVKNTGHALAPAGSVVLYSQNPLLTIQTNTAELENIAAGDSAIVSFAVNADASITAGTIVAIGSYISNAPYTLMQNLTLVVGKIIEDFETGGFTSYPWQFTGGNWTATNTGAHAGTYAAKSASIANNGTTSMSVAMNVSSAGSISFYSKVSSESGYDYLKFYIDNQEKDSWSGDEAWALHTYNVTTGQHTFKWSYSKDGSQTGGSDCAWVDDITFPAIGATPITVPVMYVSEDSMTVDGSGLRYREFSIINFGSVELNGTVQVEDEAVTVSTDGDTYAHSINYTIAGNSNQVIHVLVSDVTSRTNAEANIIITGNDTNNPSDTLVVNYTVTGTDDPNDMLKVTRLEANYPNPFNPETTIKFNLKETMPVSLVVYNIKGQKVKTLVNGMCEKGTHQIVWRGNDSHNQKVSSGIYFYQIKAGNYSSIKKMVLMK